MNKKYPEVIWLMRHAETASPTLYHGAESDIELGVHGLKQIEASLNWFRSLAPTAVVSSGMRRAVATAAAIAAHCSVPHQIVPQLHERRIGELSRRPREEGERIWQATLSRWMSGDTGYKDGEAESFDDIHDRVVPAFNKLVSKFPGGRVLIVCHGVVCKVLLLSLMRGRTTADWNTIGAARNMSVSELIPDGEFWQARSLFLTPPPIAALNAADADANRLKTEA